jgi:NTE family protein
VIASFKALPETPGKRRGTYWGVGSDIAHYKLPSSLPAPSERTRQLAAIPTRLRRLSAADQERLINWGYAICDTAIRRHFPPAAPSSPPQFPYPIVV